MNFVVVRPSSLLCTFPLPFFSSPLVPPNQTHLNFQVQVLLSLDALTTLPHDVSDVSQPVPQMQFSL